MSAAMAWTGRKVIRLDGTAQTRVRVLRMRARLTQRRLGELLGVAGSTVCAWERGRSHPSRLARIRLAEYEEGKLKKPVQIVWSWE